MLAKKAIEIVEVWKSRSETVMGDGRWTRTCSLSSLSNTSLWTGRETEIIIEYH